MLQLLKGLLNCCAWYCILCSRCGLTNSELRKMMASLHLDITVLLIQPRVDLLFLQLNIGLYPTSDPTRTQTFPDVLLPNIVTLPPPPAYIHAFDFFLTDLFILREDIQWYLYCSSVLFKSPGSDFQSFREKLWKKGKKVFLQCEVIFCAFAQ